MNNDMLALPRDDEKGKQADGVRALKHHEYRPFKLTEVQKMALAFVVLRSLGALVLIGYGDCTTDGARIEVENIGRSIGIDLYISGRASKGEWRAQNQWVCRNLFLGNRALTPPNKSKFIKVRSKPLTEKTEDGSAKS